MKMDRTNFWIMVAVFLCSITFFTTPFEGYLYYLIFFAVGPFLLPKYGFNKKLLGIFALLLVIGVLHIGLGNNTPKGFLKTFLGAFLSTSFYYLAMRYNNLDAGRVFRFYLKGAYVVAWIGLIQWVSFIFHFTPGYNFGWILNKWSVSQLGGTGLIRLNSILSEPSTYAMIIGPAAFVSICHFFFPEKIEISRKYAALILFTYFLSLSSVTFIALFLMLFLLMINYASIRQVVFTAIVVPLMISFLYNNVSDFRERVNSSTALFEDGENMVKNRLFLTYINGSSFTQFDNFIVAYNNFIRNPLTGTGLGSHPVAYGKYSLTRFFEMEGFDVSNKQDANSLLFRLMSETGLLGLVFFFVIIFRCYVRRNRKTGNTEYWIISNALLVVIALYLLRQGHYFINGFPLFLWMYYYNARQHRAFNKRAKAKLKTRKPIVKLEGEADENGLWKA